MNFELKPLGLAAVASEKCDALVVLIPEGFKPGKDDLSLLAGQSIKDKDLETKPGKLLQLYRPVQASAVRLVLAGVGGGQSKAGANGANGGAGQPQGPFLEETGRVFCHASA